ncbi:hypothetical protein ACFJGW_19215 [Burkholderiaceae bacterium UC74_6]
MRGIYILEPAEVMPKFLGTTLLALIPLLSLGFSHAPVLAAPETHAETDPQLQVVGSVFVVAQVRADGSTEFKPEKVAPLTAGQGYGWVISLKTERKQVRWREEFTLPATPQSWGASETPGKRELINEERTHRSPSAS